MIVRRNLKLSIVLRLAVKPSLTYMTIAVCCFLLYEIAGLKYLVVPFSVVATLGTALAIILGFRNNASYDRWWEARKIWGGIVNQSRSLGKQVTTMVTGKFGAQPIDEGKVKEIQRELLYRHLAWINALRLQLRNQDKWRESLGNFLDAGELEWLLKRKNKATQLVQRQAERLKDLHEMGAIEDFRHMQLDNTLTELYNLQGMAERIKNTPLARQYDYFPKLFLWLFILLFPFGLVDTFADQGVAWLVIPLTMAVGYVFFVIRRVGEFNEDPFENRITDTPMTALCRTIEIDIREQLKEEDLPPKLEPVDGFLF